MKNAREERTLTEGKDIRKTTAVPESVENKAIHTESRTGETVLGEKQNE